MRTALITGVTGQDGAYLARLLVGKGYTVHGIKRRSASSTPTGSTISIRIRTSPGCSFFMHYGDMTDATNLIRIIQETQPDEIYNLAPRPTSGSFETPSTPRTPTPWERSGCSRPSASWGWRRCRFYRPPPRSCTAMVRSAAARDHAFYPRSPYARGQALRLLDHRQLPRGLRHARLQRDPVQPREPDPRRDLRHPQDHPGGGARSSSGCKKSCIWAIWTPCATGVTRATMSRHVADRAAGPAGRLRDRHRRAPHGARVRGPGVCRGRDQGRL